MKTLTILDWKSASKVSKPEFNGYEEAKLQVAAYIEAYNLEALATHKELVTAGGILYLDKETGFPKFINATEGWETNFAAFAAAREYFRLKIEPTASDKRFYKHNGEKFPSVTTVLGILDKPALIQWAANSAVECITDALEELRDPKTADTRIAQILKSAKTEFRKVSRKAMDIGTLVHDAIETHLSGGDPSKLLDGNDAATNGFLAFLEWAGKVHLEPVKLEIVVHHPVLRYAGTADFLGYLDLDGPAAPATETKQKEEETDVF